MWNDHIQLAPDENRQRARRDAIQDVTSDERIGQTDDAVAVRDAGPGQERVTVVAAGAARRIDVLQCIMEKRAVGHVESAGGLGVGLQQRLDLGAQFRITGAGLVEPPASLVADEIQHVVQDRLQPPPSSAVHGGRERDSIPRPPDHLNGGTATGGPAIGRPRTGHW